MPSVAANAAPDLPAGFGEAFDIAWRSGTEFHNSAAYSIAQSNALSEYRDNQATPPELEPQGIENPRIWRKSGCREWIHRVHHTVCITHCM